MLTNILIVSSTFILFIYWFRFTCAVVLSRKTQEEHAWEIAAQHGLNFVHIKERLTVADSKELGGFHRALQRDYWALNNLRLKQGGQPQTAGSSVDRAMLRIDFWLLNIWNGVARTFSPARSRAGLKEMCQIVAHFASAVDERTPTTSKAACAPGRCL